MKQAILSIILCGLCLSLIPPATAETFLVKDGQPRAEIVIAEKPSRMTKIAAEEIQTYVEKISDAKLPVRTTPSGGEAIRIFIGPSAHTFVLTDATITVGRICNPAKDGMQFHPT